MVPAVPKRYIYKVYTNSGIYLGTLPQVLSDYNCTQAINTGGSNITIKIGVSADTANLPPIDLTDESYDQLTDENSNDLTTEAQIPIAAAGNSVNPALVQNGNRIQVWESSQYHVNGICLFRGQIQNWQATFGGDAQDDSITIIAYSDGIDLDQYMLYAPDVILDQEQTSYNQDYGFQVFTPEINGGYYPWLVAQSFVAGGSATNLLAVNLMLATASNINESVTVSIYSGIPQVGAYNISGSLLGSASNIVTNASNTAQVYQFAFTPALTITPGDTYTIVISGADDNGAIVYTAGTQEYSAASAYSIAYVGYGQQFVWSVLNQFNVGESDDVTDVTPVSIYFETYYGTLDTTGSYTDADPTTGMLEPILTLYNSQGGLIVWSSETIEATGLSLTYQFNNNTVYEGIQDMLTLAPDGFYFYVDMGTDTLYFKQANTTADIYLTKGANLNSINLQFTIEQLVNKVFLTGGQVEVDDVYENIYVADQSTSSINQYGPFLDRPTNTSILDTTTANTVAFSEIAERDKELNSTVITVLDSTMDLTLFNVGMNVGFNGFGSWVDSIVLTIVQIQYTPEQATLTLGIIPKRLNSTVEQTTRNVIALSSINNPITPS